MQPVITVIADHPEHAIGAQIQAMLVEERYGQIDLLERLPPPSLACVDPPPALVIPVLPTSEEKAGHLLNTLRTTWPPIAPPLLLVTRAKDLAELFPLLHAHEFLVTPLRPVEVRARVHRLLAERPAQACAKNQEALRDAVGLAQLVGEDPAFVALKAKLPLVACCESPVLLMGETGTGKELFARTLHYMSRRSSKPFLPVNCGAIPVELFESELFGREKGAFTGAWATRPGLIAEAGRGTLFLDEIGALPLGAQAKLLRFLEDQTYHVLGSPRLRQADVRVLAATNVPLMEKVRDGTFRADLFYRLAVLTLTIPPLRERRADISRLVAHFCAQAVAAPGKEMPRFSPQALEVLCAYAWPGNIRELESVIQQALVLTGGHTIEPPDLPLPREAGAFPATSFQQGKGLAIAQFEQAFLAELLLAHQGNVTHAAKSAQMGRRTLGRLIKKYHLEKD